MVHVYMQQQFSPDKNQQQTGEQLVYGRAPGCIHSHNYMHQQYMHVHQGADVNNMQKQYNSCGKDVQPAHDHYVQPVVSDGALQAQEFMIPPTQRSAASSSELESTSNTEDEMLNEKKTKQAKNFRCLYDEFT